jgi:uncharacterized membrane protein
MSNTLFGLGVFTCSLAIITYLEEIRHYISTAIVQLVPYESWLAIGIVSAFLILIYYAYRTNRTEDKLKHFYNPSYKTTEEFERQKKH